MEIRTDVEAYIGARDRALQAVVTAPNSLDAQACWRLAKQHNMVAKGRETSATGADAPLLASGERA